MHDLRRKGQLPREVGRMKTVQGHLVLGHLFQVLRTGMKNELLAHPHQQYRSQEIFQIEKSKLS